MGSQGLPAAHQQLHQHRQLQQAAMAMGNWARLIEKLAKLYIWSKLCLSIDGVKYPFFFFFVVVVISIFLFSSFLGSYRSL